MVVGSERPVGPPSTMSGMRSPIWSRTQAAWVHSDAPCRLAAVAVMGRPKLLDDGAGNGSIGNAQGDVAGIGGGAQRQLGSGANDDGQRTGPESVRQFVEHGVGVACQFVGLRQRGDQQRERLLLLAALEPVDALDGMQIYGVHGEAVESVGGQGDDVTLAQARDNVVDPVWLGLIGMDAQDFRGQEGLPRLHQPLQP